MYYAKTKPVIESIKQHTDSVLKEYGILKDNYENEINNIVGQENSEKFWDLLYKACLYHDFGKINVEFQNKMKRSLGLKYEESTREEIYHNFLSPALIPKEDRKSIDVNLRTIFYQAIAYHHERGVSINADEKMKYVKYINEELKNMVDAINEEMNCGLENINIGYLEKIDEPRRIKESNENYKLYVMLKGLLHRLDHSGSAHIDVEEKVDKCIGDCTEEYFKINNWEKREPQKFAINNRDRNIVLIASTGIGKTETALLWIDDSKAIFTLPLRVSLNALYSRVKEDIKYKSVGLLHSTALDYMMEQKEFNSKKNYADIEESFEESRLLSKKLCFSTIDQVFKCPFKYIGYEKILSTLAYSKIVIDEIQAYSPDIAAVILYGIKQLSELGGRFMIMTATLPRIYKDRLKEFGIEFEEKKCLTSMIRHKISMDNTEIVNDIDKIAELGKHKKVLAIVNTVKKAEEIYNLLEEKEVNVNLLHSMFINRDRTEKEKAIKDFTDEDENKVDIKNNKKESGIWVTTQLVEASLDVDFDCLFTEMSTLDSLFQRLGRCYRKRAFDLYGPNIYIYTENVSGIGYIYDKEIFEESIKLLSKYNHSTISEEVKVNLVDKLYSKEAISGTKYYKKFMATCTLLKDLTAYSMDNKEAQRVLRDIESITVVPQEIYDENIELFMNLKGNGKKEAFREINKLTVNVPTSKIYAARDKNPLLAVRNIDNIRGVFLINAKYSKEHGLDLNELVDTFI
ncbi:MULTISPECIES: CRISPR-associated helicase/endonuclease Cas3 [Clostridium]|uniref:CRISPR-associated helicase, Cas3 family n=1 Tax=Clostridium cadaveris TaxID=1529 RepID=A0A1I2MJM3_9CLOT|nr:CRISPR-associated helicase/endonuclease Cas3 [Clostridium cadaveris]MDU4952687.1 CRISPR-associated helicase/endonuclease Cas3 [Clostridium sp.]MDM8311485.1 CRISPR-associated helicase/endonuclease Cas3 [Clostridium cadaveris]NME64897.1 CRISPR-associated helicase/endonuclease Cas3 [Clostridium cadaveris]PWL53904.1 MAG: CRISPR-associated helicase/endonuclease Cas3 [Clostridium cadaveris]UFH65242.1 CRISPR-associated helicase/endonuclease Cas3 [Clostridium cadaveris]